MPPGPGAHRAILVSTMSILAGGGVALAGSLVLRVLMARALDPDALGLVLLAIAIVTPAGSIAGLGMNPALAQRIAERLTNGDDAGARSMARQGQLLSVGFGAAAALLLALLAGPLALLLNQPGLERNLLAIAPVALGLAAGSTALGISRGFGDSVGRAVVRDSGGGILRVLGVGTALLAGTPTSFGVAAGFAAGSLAAEVLFVAYVGRKGWLAGRTGAPPDPLLPALRPFAATEVLTQATLWVDVVVLGALAPAAVVGLYGVARGLTRVLDLVRQASSHGYLPTASAAVTRGETASLTTLHLATRRFAFALVWPVLAVCLLAPAPLLGLLFGSAYEEAAPILRLLALASFLPSFFDYLELLLVAERRPGQVLQAGAAGVATLVALLVLLAPAWGGTGTALALLGAGLVRGVLLHRFAFKTRPFRPFLPAVTEPLALAAISLATGALLLARLRPGPIASLLLAAATGTAASAVLLLSLYRTRAAGEGRRPAGEESPGPPRSHGR